MPAATFCAYSRYTPMSETSKKSYQGPPARSSQIRKAQTTTWKATAAATMSAVSPPGLETGPRSAGSAAPAGAVARARGVARAHRRASHASTSPSTAPKSVSGRHSSPSCSQRSARWPRAKTRSASRAGQRSLGPSPNTSTTSPGRRRRRRIAALQLFRPAARAVAERVAELEVVRRSAVRAVADQLAGEELDRRQLEALPERLDRLADAGADDGGLAAAGLQLDEEVVQARHAARRPRARRRMSSARGACDQRDLPVEHLGVAHAVVVRLLLELPPGVADERLQRDLVALVRRHRAVVVEEGEEARAGGAARARACGPVGHAGVYTGAARVCSRRAQSLARAGRIAVPARSSRKRVP